MRFTDLLAPTGALLLASALPLSAAALEDWQFDDAADTQLNLVANSVGTAFWSNDDDVKTDGSGNLVFVQGTGTDPDNVFRNATLTNKDLSTGTYELSYRISAATLAGGDATGANVGFGLRDDGGTDLFVVRLMRQNSALRLEYRTASTTLLDNFNNNLTTLADLEIRAVVDLDADTCDVYWKLGSNNGKCVTGLALGGTGLEADLVRLAANTNVADWGAADEVKVDYVTFGTYTAPTPQAAIEDWQFDDAAGASFNDALNSAGTTNLGGAAANALTDGSGNMEFTVGSTDADNIFRTSDLSDPGQTTGIFEMEWFVTSADLSGGDATGANFGFGMRETGTNKDLFLVRVHIQNDTLRLQHRVGNTNTDLIDFGTTSVSDLLIRVSADLDTDTFSVFWQQGTGIGQCVSDIPMFEPGLSFDIIRTAVNTNNIDWGPTDFALVDYLTIRGPSAVAAYLSLSIVSGPGAEQMTLIWPTATPGTAVLESSTNLMDPWTEITDTPTVNGDNNELIISTTGVPKNFFRLRNP
ncbi:MAG: hypothetical protein H7A50_16070 [Akkermansiaceae bacterium]|nr:hypothetical protein [Akkermansiaceae bacterium]